MEKMSEQQMNAEMMELKRQDQSLTRQIIDIEADITEHGMVLTALKPMEEGRRTWRLVGGSLLEENVSSTLPQVEENQRNLQEIVKEFEKNLTYNSIVKMEKMSEQQMNAEMMELKRQDQSLTRQIIDIEADITEHGMVLTALKPMEEGRRTWRLVGGSLLEENVSSTLPQVEENQRNLQEIVKEFEKKLAGIRQKQEQLQRNMSMHRSELAEAEAVKEESKTTSTGVLV
eukprot:TRINITY_DN809_c0_g1_i1.p1 TRINITY_DN809_c0_g1~~TRINITY_DN809_c0_g1_i1.p1  ORF type:complete len:246 (-),score=93.10 TRINITY_DN809_c0_g1_i1:163-852(-)